MSVNHHVYKVKVGAPPGLGWNQAYEELSVLLEDRLLHRVLPGTPQELLALSAAAIALDWVCSGRMCFYSHGFRGFLFAEANRRGVGGSPLDNPPAPAGFAGAPDQWAAQAQRDATVRDLIHLTRRVWLYHRLRETRQSVWGWIGEFADNVGITGPAMATERTRLSTTLEHLEQAWVALFEEGSRGDAAYASS
jgi:hypothetical protein